MLALCRGLESDILMLCIFSICIFYLENEQEEEEEEAKGPDTEGEEKGPDTKGEEKGPDNEREEREKVQLENEEHRGEENGQERGIFFLPLRRKLTMFHSHAFCL